MFSVDNKAFGILFSVGSQKLANMFGEVGGAHTGTHLYADKVCLTLSRFLGFLIFLNLISTSSSLAAWYSISSRFARRVTLTASTSFLAARASLLFAKTAPSDIRLAGMASLKTVLTGEILLISL